MQPSMQIRWRRTDQETANARLSDIVGTLYLVLVFMIPGLDLNRPNRDVWVQN